MTLLYYGHSKDESNCILLAEVFDSPKNGGSAQINECKRWGGQRVIQKKKGGKVFSTRKG